MLVYGLWVAALCLSSFTLILYGFGDGDLGSSCNDSYSSACCDTVFLARATCFACLTWMALFLASEVLDMHRSFFRMQPGSKRYATQWMHNVWRNKFHFWAIIAGVMRTRGVEGGKSADLEANAFGRYQSTGSSNSSIPFQEISGNIHRAPPSKKRPGPMTTPLEVRPYKQHELISRIERSYPRERKVDVILFLIHHRVKNDQRRQARAGCTNIELSDGTVYRPPTTAEALAYWKIPDRTIRAW
ncbi:hypothetical protein K469DRAFT_750733 [Zopfia rhizophila CBS 207.26]|uniref:Uncharacterized protein n=1 Tax=Zopfia rhizophila CBS 207.26 TaxID=1314779 RepID=A0A6A6E2E9_9PEZI|nr:hypothetical protein K469DRAFT_750733 [Zopfia rhizophila CBS 207.26]